MKFCNACNATLFVGKAATVKLSSTMIVNLAVAAFESGRSSSAMTVTVMPLVMLTPRKVYLPESSANLSRVKPPVVKLSGE